MRTKFIVTNKAVLAKKYGESFAEIEKAIKRLIAADKARGITTTLFDLSETVTKAKDPKQNKEAIDAIYNGAAQPPDYLMILGSIDVVPHQDLINPLHGGEDDDAHAWGDLPYACEAPYSREIRDFTEPTRVVGRLPDIQGKADTGYFVKLIDNAAKWVSLSPESYDSYFAVSTQTWQKSTKLSVKKVFGKVKNVFVSPKSESPWKATDLAPLAHFINCHGALGRSEFYGEGNGPDGKKTFPVAHHTVHLRDLIEPGTVAAVECCYGAELYKPTKTIDPERGICQEYLHDDAYGFFGSTTIAYGPADTHGAADIICAAFLKHVRAGDSLGLAALAARQDFIKACNLMDPVDLKTLGQFNLLGDPSIHPVHTAAKATAKTLATAKSSPKAFAAARAEQPALDDGYRERRNALRAKAPKLSARLSIATATVVPDAATDAKARAAAEAAGISPSSVKTFEVRGGQKAVPKGMKGIAAAAAAPASSERICVVTGRRAEDGDPAIPIAKTPGQRGPAPFVVAVMKADADGSMKMIRQVHSK